MNIELLPAVERDAVAFVALRIAAMRESLERVGRFDAARARARFLNSFSVSDTRHIVVDGRRAGFVALRVESGEQHLDHLYVHPAQQGRGIGSWVLTQLLCDAACQGTCVRVGALKESDSNRFYRRHGFHLVDVAEWDNYYVWSPDRASNAAPAQKEST